MYIFYERKKLFLCVIAFCMLANFAGADFSDNLTSIGINIDEINNKDSISRYELSRLLNAVGCQDCLTPPVDIIQRYNRDFWGEFLIRDDKDFSDILWNNAMYAGNNYFHCVAYVGEKDFMRGYPSDTSPICNGFFCGSRDVNRAEFIQVMINILSEQIYDQYLANRIQISQWMNNLDNSSYAYRHLNDTDRSNIEKAFVGCSSGACKISSRQEFNAYMKYCMFNLRACNMRRRGDIGQAHWPVAEINILQQQNIIDRQRANNISVYELVDGKTILDLLGSTHEKVQCEWDIDYSGDGIANHIDNCPYHYNPSQIDTDGDGVGDVCDDDIDGDGVKNPIGIVDDSGNINIKLLGENEDNCIFVVNPDQADSNQDGVGDACSDNTLSMYINTLTNSCSIPFDASFSAITQGTIIGEISWNMGDGTEKRGSNIRHMFSRPGRYQVEARASGVDNQAIASTTIVVGEDSSQDYGIQIVSNTNHLNRAGDIVLRIEYSGDIEYVQWDFGGNNRINRAANQSIVRNLSRNATYPIVVRGFRGNTMIALSRSSISVGGDNISAILNSIGGTSFPIGENIVFETKLGNIDTNQIQSIIWDMGDGTRITNNNTNISHAYDLAGSRIVNQRITLNDGRQIFNDITINIYEAGYRGIFAKNLSINPLSTIENAEVKYRTNVLCGPEDINYNMNLGGGIGFVENIVVGDEVSYRYEKGGTYNPTSMININQCVDLSSTATINIQRKTQCEDIFRSNRLGLYCDMDGDGIPDICDDDIDGDGVKNLIGLVMFDNPDCSIGANNINEELLRRQISEKALDNCPFMMNTNQQDLNISGIGDACEEEMSSILSEMQVSTTEQTLVDNISVTNVIGDLSCPLFLSVGEDNLDDMANRCPLNTRLCNDNTCQSNCANNAGERSCNLDGVCDVGESCSCPDCLGKQDFCQNGLVCGENQLCSISNTGTNTNIRNPNRNICDNMEDCYGDNSISVVGCNQCPCPYVEIDSMISNGDRIRSILMDRVGNIIYNISNSLDR